MGEMVEQLTLWGEIYPYLKIKEPVILCEFFSGIGLSVKRYLGIIESNTKFRCPKMLEYQFTPEFKIKCSDNCCRKMKKEPVKKWEKASNRHIGMTGMRNSEGGERASIKGCILTDKSGNLTKFHPLIKVNDEWENWFIEYYNNTHTHIGTRTTLLPTLQFQKNRVQGLSVLVRFTRTIRDYGTLYA